MQDYEYYEAHANDVKLGDITSDEDNADILACLRDNDPDLKYFSTVTEREDDGNDFVVREGDHLGWLGYFAGRNETIETLYIDNIPDNINLNTFLQGLGHNRSIKTLHIWADLGESFQSLIPFLRYNDSLRHLNFNYFDIGLQCARNIALLLSQRSSMKRLTFNEVINFDDEGLAQVAIALRSQPQIEELNLNSYNVGRDGYVALGSALEGCVSLKKLELSAYDNHGENEGLIDDEGLHALAEGLKYCHNLLSLELYGTLIIAEEGSRSFSTLFQSENCRLEHLVLIDINIGDDEMAVLATGLASLPTLKWLKLYGMSISDQGLQDFVRGLVNCTLEELDISGNTMTVSGLRSLGKLVRRTTSMHSLSLVDSAVSDEGLQSFVEGMANCCNLRDLYLSCNRLITANGLASLTSLFRAKHCTLCTLFLYGIRLGDDGAVALANGLVGNKSLTELRFSSTDSGITARGWAAFSRLLCDTSSVNNTYLSNHTLEMVGCSTRRDTPSDIQEYLKLNESQNHGDAAICKILDSHPDIDVTPLFGFNLMCLPLVVKWFEKAKSYLDETNESTESFKCRQLSAVYRFIRGMPLLAADGYRRQNVKDVQLQLELKSKKRKLEQTL